MEVQEDLGRGWEDTPHRKGDFTGSSADHREALGESVSLSQGICPVHVGAGCHGHPLPCKGSLSKPGPRTCCLWSVA